MKQRDFYYYHLATSMYIKGVISFEWSIKYGLENETQFM